MNRTVFSTNDAGISDLADRIAAGAERGAVIEHVFPDGEPHLRFEGTVRDRECIVVADLRSAESGLLRLMMLCDAFREAGAGRIVVVAPYMPFMRQDSKFSDGDVLSSAAIARLLSQTCDEIFTVDPHLHRIDSLQEIFTVPAHVIASAPAIGAWIAEHVENPCIVGPDEEAEQWARAAAEAAGCPWLAMTKERRGDRDVEVTTGDFGALTGLEGRTPVLVDDIISTGSTLARAREELARLGFTSTTAVGVHAVFAPGADECLRTAGFERVVTANTIAHDSNAIDVSALIAASVLEGLSG